MIALTFDTDWMEPNDLYRFLEEYDFPGEATFFLHRPYPALVSTHHELCPHPLSLDESQLKETISSLLVEFDLKPSGLRSHSCAHSHLLELALYELGFQYTSNSSQLFANDIQPVRLAWGLWEMPIYYMDNLDLTMVQYWPTLDHKPLNPEVLLQAINGHNLYVFDFHPLHICLNTPNLKYYLERQHELKKGVSPFDFCFDGRGVGTFFTEFCEMMSFHHQVSIPLKNVLKTV